MEPGRQFRAIWDFRWWIALTVLVASLVAFFVSRSLPPTYEATALVQVTSGDRASGSSVSPDEVLQLTNIYERQARATTVVQQAGRSLEPAQPVSTFEDRVSVASEQQTGVLSFEGTAHEGGDAARYANAYARAFVAYVENTQAARREEDLGTISAAINELRRQLATADGQSRTTLTIELQALQSRAAEGQLAPRDTAQPLEAAAAPMSASSPKPIRDAILVGLVALVLAMAFPYLRSNFSDRYRSADEAVDDLGLPLLGIVPRGKPGAPAVMEAFRLIRTTIAFASKADRNGTSETLLIASAEAGAGKTFTTFNLARAFASSGRRVLAIDGDLRRPTLHRLFGVDPEPGLREALNLEHALDGQIPAAAERIRITRVLTKGELDLVTAGSPIEPGSEHLLTGRAQNVIEDLQRTRDLILFDSPPLLNVADAALLGRYATTAILVVDSRKTRPAHARRAVQLLSATGTPILGLIVNRARGVDELTDYAYSAHSQRSRLGISDVPAS